MFKSTKSKTHNTKTFKAISLKMAARAVINFEQLQLLQFMSYNLHLYFWGFQVTHLKTPKMEVKTGLVGEGHI